LLPTGKGLSAVLDNIRSIHNVGSMFRTADGAGLDRLYLCGITATPEHPRLPKAALGAETAVPWTYQPNAVDVVFALKVQGVTIWALERATDASESLSLFDQGSAPLPLALIVGNEKAGVDPELLAFADGIYSLPMRGHKTSLNAAVAFGIATYYLENLIYHEN